MKKLLAIFAVSLLTACASFNVGLTPQQIVFKAKQSYEAALTVAVAYKNLPVCAPTSPPICSKLDVVVKLQKVDIATSALLNAAENTVRTEGVGMNVNTAITAANQAVLAFTTITNSLVVR